jgi:hypothetical protein
VVDGAHAASVKTGIPENTIRTWMESPEFGELRDRTKEQVAGEWWAIVQKGFRRVAKLLDTTDDAQKAATATAIIFDKLALTRGEATSRTETKDITLDDHEAEVLGQVIRAELARRADEHAVESAVESAASTGAETPAG